MEPLLNAIQIVGVTLVVAAVVLHVCLCDWHADGDLIWLISVAPDFRDNKLAVVACGIVLPILLAGAGIAMVVAGQAGKGEK